MKWGEELVDNNKGYYPILGICMGIEMFALYAYDNGKVTFHILCPKTLNKGKKYF